MWFDVSRTSIIALGTLQVLRFCYATVCGLWFISLQFLHYLSLHCIIVVSDINLTWAYNEVVLIVNCSLKCSRTFLELFWIVVLELSWKGWIYLILVAWTASQSFEKADFFCMITGEKWCDFKAVLFSSLSLARC